CYVYGASCVFGVSLRCVCDHTSLFLACQLAGLVVTSVLFFNDPATTEIYTLSLHDALPIYHLKKRCSASVPCGESSSRKRHGWIDRKSTRLNSSHVKISYAVFCLKKKTNTIQAASATAIAE